MAQPGRALRSGRRGRRFESSHPDQEFPYQSRVFQVSTREDLPQTFAYNREKQLKLYLAELKAGSYQPKLSRTDDGFAIRVHEAGHRPQCLYALSEKEAIDIKQRMELERRNGLFVDYAKGRSVTFADLLARYLRAVSPRRKGFEVEGYIINALLSDAGLARVDMAQAYADHKNPHPNLEGKTFRKPSGRKMRVSSPAVTCFVFHSQALRGYSARRY